MAVWVAEAHYRQAVAGAEIVRYSSAAEVMGRVIVDSLGTAAMVQGAAAKGEKIFSTPHKYCEFPFVYSNSHWPNLVIGVVNRKKLT